MSDQKIKAASEKAPLGMVPAQALVGPSRVYGYGAKKYAPGNYYNATLEDGAGQRYVSAALRHLSAMQQPNGLHTPESLAARDEESGLPHLDHTICGLLMLRTIMTKCGALPVDPGQGRDPAAPVAKLEIAPEVRMQTTCDLGLLKPQNRDCQHADRALGQHQPGDCSTYQCEPGSSWKQFVCSSCERYYNLGF
jgi:hypothetical protein